VTRLVEGVGYIRRVTGLAPNKLAGRITALSQENCMAPIAVPRTQIEDQMGRTLFIVSRQHPDLYAYLRERFATDTAVEVILDRRVRQRRQQHARPDLERRRTERRVRPEVEIELTTRSHAIITIPDVAMD
jgi:hypothetical protein